LKAFIVGLSINRKVDFVFNFIQVLSKEGVETLALCKKMMDLGECPPLMVVFDPYEGYLTFLLASLLTFITKKRVGKCIYQCIIILKSNFFYLNRFTVEADRFIKDWTIITEYVGDVDYLSNREDDYDGDSMMTLLHASDPSQCLVICPDRRSNIARFISGINNHSPEGRKKQNLKCVRFNINGEARVLLVANRDISKGERLYYDYNGYEHEYPTEHFV
jgi:hypothetical protein